LGGGGDVHGYIRNVEQAIDKIPPDAKIIPGHGPLGTIDDLKKFHAMLVGTSDFVQKEIAAGKTLEQVKTEGVPEKYKTWGNAFIKEPVFLEMLYKGLAPTQKAAPATPATPAAPATPPMKK
jgi:cyclase